MSQKQAAPERPRAPFHYVTQHFLKMPLVINGKRKTFCIFDTGIGLNLLSKKVADEFGIKPEKSYTGQRMSGQSITLPVSTIKSMTVAGITKKNVEVGIWDFNGFLPQGSSKDIECYLSLTFFRDLPFTMDYKNGCMILEDQASLEARVKAGKVVPIKVKDDVTTTTIFMPFQVPGGPPIVVELDLGSDVLILNTSLMERLKVKADGEGTNTVKGKDETANAYTRLYSKIEGEVHPENTPSMSQSKPTVMFQKIIYDGLVGNDFMKRFTVTYDLANSRLIFAN